MTQTFIKIGATSYDAAGTPDSQTSLTLDVLLE